MSANPSPTTADANKYGNIIFTSVSLGFKYTTDSDPLNTDAK
jgi:hypothetical protein